MSYRELRKPDAALYLRERAIERFPEYDVADAIAEGELIVLRDRPLVLIYSQDTFRDSEWSWGEVFGYRVFAGSRANPDEAAAVATELEAWLWTTARPVRGCPIASIQDSNGPNLVADEHETAVLYGTVEMIIAGVYLPASTGKAGE